MNDIRENNNPNELLAYLRKSTKVDNKQVFSLESQMEFVKRTSNELNHSIANIYQESVSAKISEKRVEFSKMISYIEKSAQPVDIVCWDISRLSRNWPEAATILDMVMYHKIGMIHTSSGIFSHINYNSLENQFSLAIKDSYEKPKLVKRGMKTKAEMGIYPNHAPLGYLNDKVNKSIIVDDDRFPIIRIGFDLLLTNNYSVPAILKILSDKYHLRARPTKKGNQQGTKLDRSSLYKIFHNSFYCGKYSFDGTECVGIHKKMISGAEFDRAQEILAARANIATKKRNFPYTQLITCGKCGSMITAETKSKHNKRLKTSKFYTYYHCTKRKKNAVCDQKCINDYELQYQINNMVKQVNIPKSIIKWATEILKRNQMVDINNKSDLVANFESQIKVLENKSISSIHKAESSTAIAQYLDLIIENYNYEISDLRTSIAELDKDNNNYLFRDDFINDFNSLLKDYFLMMSIEGKKSIVKYISKELILLDNKLSYKLNSWCIK